MSDIDIRRRHLRVSYNEVGESLEVWKGMCLFLKNRGENLGRCKIKGSIKIKKNVRLTYTLN